VNLIVRRLTRTLIRRTTFCVKYYHMESTRSLWVWRAKERVLLASNIALVYSSLRC
jgi:hypothetical protein